MSWDNVKEFLGSSAPVVGSLLGGPAGGAVGGLIASWLGVEDKAEAVMRKLQTDPEALANIQRMEVEERMHLRQLQFDQVRLAITDKQHQHEQQQETIRNGDTAEDEYVRRTRPGIARQAFTAGTAYVLLFEMLAAFGKGEGADMALAGAVFAPTLAYMGFRTIDAFSKHKGPKMGGVVKQLADKARS